MFDSIIWSLKFSLCHFTDCRQGALDPNENASGPKVSRNPNGLAPPTRELPPVQQA